jgi:two-component system sensor histidine kinase UhpB
MSLQFKLNLIITCLLLLMLSASAYFVIENAREDVRAEVSSTSNLVLHLLDTEIMHYTADYGWLEHNLHGSSQFFRLSNLGNIRHLKIDFYDVNGMLRESNQKKMYANDRAVPPIWFARLMGSADMVVNENRKRIVINGRFIGELVVTPDPSYEIAEVWNDTIGLLGLIIGFFLSINFFVYWAVKYTFRPMGNIIAGLNNIEQGDYSTRLPQFKPLELQAIGEKFNVMANTLQQTIQKNHRLTQQLICLQEDERKSLARDIHDEIGQYLTAIHVDASAVLKARSLTTAKASAKAISDVARQMMEIVHELLQRLRPRVIDELGIGLALRELIQHWRQRNRGISVIYSLKNDMAVVDDTVSITVYRVVQECLTNITKHSQAKRVTVKVNQNDINIDIFIEDDGVGFDQTQMTKGYGLAGMRERIQGLFGEMHMISNENGSKIHVVLPNHSPIPETQ